MVLAETHDNRTPKDGAGSGGVGEQHPRPGDLANWKAGKVRSGSVADVTAPDRLGPQSANSGRGLKVFQFRLALQVDNDILNLTGEAVRRLIVERHRLAAILPIPKVPTTRVNPPDIHQ